MHHRNLFLLCVFCIQIFGCASPSTALTSTNEGKGLMDLVEAAKNMRGLIVQIEVPKKNGNISLGSGFWLNDSGYIGTCWHVLADNPDANITVKSASDSYFDLKNNNNVYANWSAFTAKVVAKDEVNDVALLKVTVSPFNAPKRVIVKIGNIELAANYRHAPLASVLPEAGEIIQLAGYPLGNPYPIVQQGTVASIAHNLPNFGNTLKILLSLVANPGNSGGPVIDRQGNVIGLLEGGLPSRPGKDPAQAQSGIAVVVPAFYLIRLLDGQIK